MLWHSNKLLIKNIVVGDSQIKDVTGINFNETKKNIFSTKRYNCRKKYSMERKKQFIKLAIN